MAGTKIMDVPIPHGRYDYTKILKKYPKNVDKSEDKNYNILNYNNILSKEIIIIVKEKFS